MINNQLLEDLSLKIKSLAQSSPAADMEKNLRALLQGAFTKLELVSREEFEVQAAVLQLTREKLDAMEAQLNKLESTLQPKS